MPFFQNVFDQEFIGIWVLSDRQYNIDFKIGPNKNKSDIMINWVRPPYDLSVANVFGIKFSLNSGKSYAQINVTLTASATVSAEQVVTDLNGNVSFASMFEAFIQDGFILIRAKHKHRENFKSYIPNLADPAFPLTSAEKQLGFNRKAPVAEIPSYFSRHTVANYVDSVFPDSTGSIVQLSQPDENFVITNAGLSTTAQADYVFLRGRSGLFNFQSLTVDLSDRIVKIIEYPSGAKVGDLSRQIDYVYTGANTKPDKITEIPHVLVSADLITPP